MILRRPVDARWGLRPRTPARRASRPLRIPSAAAVVAAALAALLVSGTALAAPQDKQAEKALAEAMDEDYLETRFDKAEQRLRDAIAKCGDAGCTPSIKARLYIGLGTVLSGGKNQLDDAKDAFVEALKLDPKAALDPNLAKTEITYALDAARAELGKGSGAAGALGDVKHTPPAEQRVSTPLPLYVELGAAVAAKAKKVTAHYSPAAGGEWKSLVMKKVGESGWGINIPCADLGRPGELRYHVVVADEKGAVLGEAGTRKDPLITAIKDRIDGEPPHWPGFAAPEPCATGKTDGGPKQCLDDRQCSDGFSCVAGSCIEKAGPEPDSPSKKNWITVAFSPDVSLVSGEGVCSAAGQSEDHFACFREDGSRYVGTPATGSGTANNINTGPALSTMRVILGFERLVLDNVGVGARVGFAFGGASDGGASFLPLHVEARASYWIGKGPFERPGVRPVVFVNGGLAQVDTKVDVQVVEDPTACGTPDANDVCSRSSGDGVREKRIQQLTAYKQAGQGFAGLGVGVAYAPLVGLQLSLAVRGSVTFPVVSGVLSPEVGVALGF